MRKGLLYIMIFGWLFGPPSKVQEAHDLFTAGKYLEAGNLFAAQMEQYPTQMPELAFNSGQAYFMADSLERSMSQFGKTCNMAKQDPQLASWAWNNVGILHIKNLEKAQQQAQAPQGMQQGAQPAANPEQTKATLLTALQAFKDALKLNNDNDIARYNYELLMRRMKQQENQQEQQEDKKEDKQEQEQEKEEQEKNKQDQSQDQKEDSPEKKENKADQDPKQGEGEGKESQMSGEEAQRLLEAMESNEKKFLQQLEVGKKHKVYSEKDGHDW